MAFTPIRRRLLCPILCRALVCVARTARTNALRLTALPVGLRLNTMTLGWARRDVCKNKKQKQKKQRTVVAPFSFVILCFWQYSKRGEGRYLACPFFPYCFETVTHELFLPFFTFQNCNCNYNTQSSTRLPSPHAPFHQCRASLRAGELQEKFNNFLKLTNFFSFFYAVVDHLKSLDVTVKLFPFCWRYFLCPHNAPKVRKMGNETKQTACGEISTVDGSRLMLLAARPKHD